jgi:hypothetical protein
MYIFEILRYVMFNGMIEKCELKEDLPPCAWEVIVIIVAWSNIL